MFATAAVATFVFAFATVLSYRQTSASVAADVSLTMHRTADARARSAALWFESRRLLLEMANEDVAALAPNVSPEDAFKRRPLVDNFVGTYFGRSADGAFFNYPHIRALPPGYDPRKRPWFQAAVAHRDTIMIDPYPDASLKAPVVTIAAPMLRAGKVIGVTGVDFTIDNLVAMLARNRPPGGFFIIVNAKGEIVIHADPKMIGRKLDAAFEGAAPALSNGISETRIGGRTKLVTFAQVPGLPHAQWYVGLVQDKSVAYAALDQSLGRTIVFSAAMIAVSLLMTWLVLGRLVLTPLRRIIVSMRRVVEGELDQPADPNSARQDEIGEMARAVDVFRTNSQRVAELTEAEIAQRARVAEARAQMMAELRESFGRVVDSAVAGDFSGRVADRFADDELNALARSINLLVETTDRGLAETGQVLAALARTDLTKRVHGRFDGAFAKLQTDTNAVADRLAEVIRQLRDASGQLNAATKDLQTGASDLSDRTGQQARAIEDTSGAIQRLSVTVADNANSAEKASRIAHQAASSAESGRSVMQEAAATMARLNASSSTIFGVIGMIDAIASQTGLVALNASIEAARAGAAGQGFAVVATEVKSLANQATVASSEVRNLIGQTLGEIGAGSRMMAEVTGSLSQMLAAVQENSGYLEGIARANREQAMSIEEVSDTLEQIDQLTRSNAMLVRQLDAATNETKRRATELDRFVDIFSLDDSRRAARAA